jgi:hypothetical protein
MVNYSYGFVSLQQLFRDFNEDKAAWQLARGNV